MKGFVAKRVWNGRLWPVQEICNIWTRPVAAGSVVKGLKYTFSERLINIAFGPDVGFYKIWVGFGRELGLSKKTHFL